MRIAGGGSGFLAQKIIGIMRMHQRQRRIIKRHINILAKTGILAFVKRHQNTDHAIKAGSHINDWRTKANRAAFGHAVNRHHAGHRLNHSVISWRTTKRPSLTKARNPAMHKPWEPVF